MWKILVMPTHPHTKQLKCLSHTQHQTSDSGASRTKVRKPERQIQRELDVNMQIIIVYSFTALLNHTVGYKNSQLTSGCRVVTKQQTLSWVVISCFHVWPIWLFFLMREMVTACWTPATATGTRIFYFILFFSWFDSQIAFRMLKKYSTNITKNSFKYLSNSSFIVMTLMLLSLTPILLKGKFIFVWSAVIKLALLWKWKAITVWLNCWQPAVICIHIHIRWTA